MADSKNEAIPMGGSTADGTTVTAANANTAVMTAPEGDSGVPQKKNHAVVFVILGIAALLIATAVALGVLFVFATTDTMPKAPEITTDMSTVVKESALEMIKDKKISFNSDEINLFLKTLADKSEDKLAENGMQINDLFAVVSNDKATIYCRMNYKGVTWPIKVIADVSYDDPYIVISLHSANLGKLDLPEERIMNYFSKVVDIDNISIHNNFIYYDTTDFNDQISEVALSELGLTVEEVQDDTEENQGFSLKKWWNNFTKGISNSVKGWAANIVSDFIHDIKFEDVKIIDNELVIKVTFEEDSENGSVISSSDATESADSTESTDAAA